MEFRTEEEDLRSVYGDDGRRSKYHVGGRTYTCHGDESSGFLWKALDAGGDESTAVRGCHVDSLAATARVIGTVRPPQGSLGTLQCIQSTLLGRRRRNAPLCHRCEEHAGRASCRLDVLRCAAHQRLVHKEPRRISGQSMETWILKPKPVVPKVDDDLATETTQNAMEEQQPMQEEEEANPLPRPQTPPQVSVVVNEVPTSEAIPEAEAKDDPSSSSTWYQCDWFQGRTFKACDVDADCPLEKPFDVWFDATSEMVKHDARTTVHTFLNAVADRATKVDFEWTASKPEVTSTDKVRRSTLRARLQQLHRTDEASRASVDKMFQEEMKTSVANAKDGACAATTKTCRRSLTTPTTSIFDGKQRVTFQRTASGKVTYTRDGEGIVRDILARSCDAEDAPDACRDPSVEDVHSGNMAPSLSTSAPIRPSYRLHFTSSDGSTERLIVGNTIDAYGTIDATTRDTCAAQLCARNADACPAPHCQMDGTSCVPNPEKTASVNLRSIQRS